MPKQTPKVFGIGLPHSGGRLLAALFEGNGYPWRHHMAGKLAHSIAYAQACGTAPLTIWPKAAGFSGLYSMHKRHMPHLQVQDALAGLLRAFPDAYFIRTHRDPADWVVARYLADDGAHRDAAAWHAGVHETELPEHWLAEDVSHAQICREIFDANPRFLDFNIATQSIDIISEFLNQDFVLTPKPDLPDFTVTADDIETVVAQLETAPAPMQVEPVNINFATQVAEFCIEKNGSKGGVKALNGSAITWPAADRVETRTGEPADFVRQGNTFLAAPDADGLERGHAVLNELIAHDAQPPLQIDMMDARFIGSNGRRAAPRRTVVYNRREGAKNLTLWPLPGYHSLAPRGHPGGFKTDEIPFENKVDRCVWLGNMTGRMSPVLTSKDRALHGVYGIRDRAFAATSDTDWDGIIADLACVPRYNIVKTYRNHPDFVVGLVLRAKWRRLSKTPAFAGLCDPFRDRTWMHQFRYILSLAGNDTGSNFLSAASSHALILKEDDGWELFYTDAFKPWVHYVPLIEGALDVEEKLAWARANEDACAAMVAASTQLYDRFANPANRAAILQGIAQRLNALD